MFFSLDYYRVDEWTKGIAFLVVLEKAKNPVFSLFERLKFKLMAAFLLSYIAILSSPLPSQSPTKGVTILLIGPK